MNISSNSQFGLVVAYLLPGFIGLAGIAPFVPLVAVWLAPTTYAEASLGPPIYVLLAATTVGMTASCFRWLIIDRVHHWTGLTPPVWDDSRLQDRLAAFTHLVDSHYRYHQFVGNTLVALLCAYLVNRWMGTSAHFGLRTDIGVLVLSLALFAASRDALSKYYMRTGQLIGLAQKGLNGEDMYNGNDHGGAVKPAPKPQAEGKPETNPPPTPKSEQNSTRTQQSAK